MGIPLNQTSSEMGWQFLLRGSKDNNGLVEISLFEDSFSFRYVDLARCVQISKGNGWLCLFSKVSSFPIGDPQKKQEIGEWPIKNRQSPPTEPTDSVMQLGDPPGIS